MSLLQLNNELSEVLVTLLKGVVYDDHQPKVWNNLVRLQTQVRDYMAMLGLQLMVDESEGYAYLCQRLQENEENPENAVPQLVQKRQLSFPVSLLCVLLRKKLLERDAGGGGSRAILSREQIIDMMQVFLVQKSNQAKIIDLIETCIAKLVDFGFLRLLDGDNQQYEIRRIIKALIDATFLARLDEKLEEYKNYAATAD